jgi:iron-sulfur cluster assembly protein
MDVTLTPGAEKFIRRMLRFSSTADSGFRLVLTAGGCSGLAGDFTVEAAPQSGDAVFEKNGVKFFLPAESRLLLDGVTIDFADTPTQTGLVFHNPKAASCGCSSSSAKESLPGISSIEIGSISRRV